METRAKSTTEFRSEIHELLASQETRIDDIVAKTIPVSMSLLKSLPGMKVASSNS